MLPPDERAELCMQRIETEQGYSFGPEVRAKMIGEIAFSIELTEKDFAEGVELEEKFRIAAMSDQDLQAEITAQMIEELGRADEAHGPMCCLPGALMIIQEEFEELKDEVKMREPDPKKLQEEVTQLGAMCIKFVRDILTADGGIKEHGDAESS